MTTHTDGAFVRSSFSEASPPPMRTSGIVHWLRENLFSSPLNTLLSLLILFGLYETIPGLINSMLITAVWTAKDSKDCVADSVGHPVGVCWGFVNAHWDYFVFGQYPETMRWRPELFFALEAFGIAWLLVPSAPRKDWGMVYFFLIFPVIAFVLLSGSQTLGLPIVQTHYWGGFLVSIVIGTVGIVISVPLGIILALGRRSDMPVARSSSVIVIEFVRGVPLITVLFMANVMFPLFVPDGWRPDPLLRVLVGVAVFFSAYMAETVRGGLQAISRGQYEAAQALGLSYWQMMVKIILPQALKIVIPGIVNNFIGLFKDTTLVAIVSIFDFLKVIDASLNDPVWRTSGMPFAGYVFAAIVYFVLCYGMARYSMSVERRLATDHRH
jgi:general L-amino acid transport system permease protein